jgi:hypothetical protein
MPLAQDEVEVQAFPLHTTQKTLTHAVGLRRLIRRGQDLSPAPVRHSGEGVPKLVVVIANQEARAFTEGRCLPQLLSTTLPLAL